MENTPVSISLTLGEWTRVAGFLAKAPYEQVAGLINQIQRQVDQQLNPPMAPTMQQDKGLNGAHHPDEGPKP